MPTPAIPASQIVKVIPSVIAAGGSALDLSGLCLTQSPRIPIGTVPAFPSQAAVAAYFGSTSPEAIFAADYFNGFDGSTVKPGALLMAQYPWLAGVGGWLRGANLGSMTLTQLQALSGSLNVTVDGVVKTAGSISLSGASSFSAAALLIASGLSLTPLPAASFTGSSTLTVLTVTAVASGVLAAGQTVVQGTTGTTIVNQLTSTETDGHLGGKGTYTISISQTISAGALTTTSSPVVYDSLANAFEIFSSTTGTSSGVGFGGGTLAGPLLLQQSNGAVISPGAAIAVPATFMNGLIRVTEDWASFTTIFEPVDADKIAFANWNNTQGNSYEYEMWTTNGAATVVPDTTSAGASIQTAGYSGTKLIYTTGANGLGAIAAFQMGSIASLDTAALNGRATMAFRSQAGLAPEVTDGTVSTNLLANGYSFYGDYSTRNQDFVFFYDGSVTGPFNWGDTYVDQIWMSSSFQLAMMSLLVSIKSIPYNTAGYALIRAALLDPIQAFVNFGAIRSGVSLSNLQAAEVNNAAGVKIDDILTNRGWYLQILDPTPQVRAARGTPICNFWYTDGESVQSISLASVTIL